MAARKNNRFVPTFEALEAREVTTVSQISPPAALLDHPRIQEIEAPAQVVHDAGAPQALTVAPTAAAPTQTDYADPLTGEHRTYVRLKDLKKGDILLNTTNAWL